MSSTGASHACPRCAGESLQPGRIHDVEVEMCSGCQGLLLRQARLIPLLDQMTCALEKSIDADQEIAPVGAGAPRIDCPACGRGMERNGYMGTNLVEIDSCPGCWSIWVDCDEIGPMAILYARTHVRGAIREEEAKAREPSIPVMRPSHIQHTHQMRNEVRGVLIDNFIGLILS